MKEPMEKIDLPIPTNYSSIVSKFCDYYIGLWSNKDQAYKYPTRFSYVFISNYLIDASTIYSEQYHVGNASNPYRQTILSISEISDKKIVASNYNLLEPKKHIGGFDMYSIKEVYKRNNCDVVIDLVNDYTFKGKIETNNCIVTRNNKPSYVVNELLLSNTDYVNSDRGFDPVTNEQLWGTEYGPWRFKRVK